MSCPQSETLSDSGEARTRRLIRPAVGKYQGSNALHQELQLVFASGVAADTHMRYHNGPPGGLSGLIPGPPLKPNLTYLSI